MNNFQKNFKMNDQFWVGIFLVERFELIGAKCQFDNEICQIKNIKKEIQMIQAFERLSLNTNDYMSQFSSQDFSQKLLEKAPLHKLDSIRVTNFKSFKQQLYIGPFLNFTSVIGPNGAGKSNILEALMFCFCNEKQRQTYFDAREFITRTNNQTYNQLTQEGKFCRVQARFILKNLQTLVLSRELDAEGNEKFSIDYENYDRKVYENFLLRCNINPVSTNYAIWQGDVDKILLKSPTDLTYHIEVISGSIFYKGQYEKVKEGIEIIRKSIEMKNLKASKLKLEKKSLKNIKQSNKQLYKLQTQYQQVTTKCFHAKMFLSELDLRDYQAKMQEKHQEEKEKIRKINQNKAILQNQQKNKVQLEKKMKNCMKDMAQIHSKLKLMEQPDAILQQQKQNQLKNDVELKRTFMLNLQNQKKILEENLPKIHDDEIIEEYRKIHSKWENENFALSQELTKKKHQFLHFERLYQSNMILIQDSKHSEIQSQNKYKEYIRQCEIVKNDIHEMTTNISRVQMEVARGGEEINKGLSILEEKSLKLDDLNNHIFQIENLLTEDIENQKDKEVMKKLLIVDGFKGIIEQKVKPTTAKYEVCFLLLMSPILKYLLCTSDQASKQIMQKLIQIGKVKTLVILNQVKPKQETIPKSALAKMGILAKEIIEIQHDLINFDHFVYDFLDGKVVCENFQMAKKIRDKRIKGVKQIYTYDGHVIKSDGTLSTFGKSDRVKKNYKYLNVENNKKVVTDDLQKLEKQKIKLEEQIKDLKLKYNEQDLMKKRSELMKMQRKRQQLQDKLAFLNKVIQQFKHFKKSKHLEKEIAEISSKRDKLQASIVEMQKQIQSSKLFDQFLNKYNITSLESFRNSQNFSDIQRQVVKFNQIKKELHQVQKQMNKISNQISEKQQKLKKIELINRNMLNLAQKKQLEELLRKNQEQFKDCREQIVKMPNFMNENLHFKAEVPEMQKKFEKMKENNELLKLQLSNSLGIEMKQQEKLDFSILQEDLAIPVEKASKRNIENILTDYEKQKLHLEGVLDKINLTNLTNYNPNLEENQERIMHVILRIEQELIELTNSKKVETEKFQTIRRDRRNLFLNFMEKLKPYLIEAYEILTLDENGFKGKIDIYMENQDLPFDYGLFFSPTPPTKRFVYDLQYLSGGEKSLASLALQYALALTSKSPFLILDETDAYLDNSNVQNFGNLIKKSLASKALNKLEKQIQFILITHKKGLFENSESLIGVNRPKYYFFSKIFSLKLLEDNPESSDTQ